MRALLHISSDYSVCDISIEHIFFKYTMYNNDVYLFYHDLVKVILCSLWLGFFLIIFLIQNKL